MSSDSITPARERGILAVLAAVQFTSIVDFMIVMPFGPELERSFGLSPSQFGWIVSSYTYAAGVSGLFAAVHLDRFGRRTAFLSLFAGFLTGTFACGLATNYSQLLAARVLTGAFGGLLGGLALAIVGDVFPYERRGQASGVLMSAFALASVFGVPAGITLGQTWGWHVPFFILGGLGLPIFAIAAVVLPPLDNHRGHPRAPLWETLTDPNHRRAFALTTALMFGGFTVVPFLSPYLVANVRISEDHLAVVYIVGGVLTLIGSPIVGRLADRYGKLLVFRCVSPLFVIAIVVATNMPPIPLVFAAFAMAFVMVSSSGRMIPAMAMTTASVAPHRRGGFLAANAAVQHIAAGLGASIGGEILVKASDGRLLHYGTVGIISVAATAISLWLAGRLRVVANTPPTDLRESLVAAAHATADVD